MSKYEDLSRLQKLKENGNLTDSEYEVEKYKILNSTDKQVNFQKTKPKGKMDVIMLIVLIVGVIGVYSIITSIIDSIRIEKDIQSRTEDIRNAVEYKYKGK